MFFILFLSLTLFNTLVLTSTHVRSSMKTNNELYSSIIADFQRVELDANKGVSCTFIVSEPEASRHGRIKVFLEELKLNDGQTPKDLKIPVLLFRYEDILNFTSLPSNEEYDRGYASNYSANNLNWDDYFLKNTVNFEENKFILELYEGYNEIDELRLYNGFLETSKESSNYEAVLPVYTSGMYCAYIAPPIDREIKIMRVPVDIKFSRLYSSDMMYAHYCETKYIIGVGLLLLAYLVYNISRGGQWSIRSMPIISKAVIFYVLVPLLSFVSLEWFIIFIEIHCKLNSRKIRFFEYFRLMNGWVQPNWKILLQFYVLLFTMGYGVIYYNKGASRTFSKMPKRAKNVACSLFITNIILSNVKIAYNKYDAYLMTYHYLALHEDIIKFLYNVCALGSLIFPFVWFLVSFIYYFKTRNIIRKLPPTSTITEGVDANTRIRKAFNQSSLVIFISPSLSVLIWFSSLGLRALRAFYSMSNVFSSDLDILEKPSSREALIQLIRLSNHLMLFTEDNVKSVFENWPRAFKIYLTIGLLYMIWIRNNNALVVEDEKEDLKE